LKSKKKLIQNPKGLECLNCGFPFNGDENYCPNCSQNNDIRKFSIKEIIIHFLGGFFAFDSMFYKTLKPLIFSPGKVSREFIEGKRKKYTNPFQLLLHTSIVFFLVLGLITTIEKFSNLDSEYSKKPNQNTDLFNNYSEQKFDSLYLLKLDSINKKANFIKLLKASNTSKTQIDSVYNELYVFGIKMVFGDSPVEDLGRLSKDIKLFANHSKHTLDILNEYLVQNEVSNIPTDFKIPDELDTNLSFSIQDSTSNKKWNLFYNYAKNNEEASPGDALDSLKFPKTKTNLFLYQKVHEMSEFLKDSESQEAFINSILSKTSFAQFFLLPLFTFIFWLLYLRHKYIYTDHLILVFNLQTVFFLLLLTGIVLDSIFNTHFFKTISIFLFLFYFYKALRNFYQQKRFKTIVKFIFINISYFIFCLIGFFIISFLVFLL
jgi:hypothetical protein